MNIEVSKIELTNMCVLMDGNDVLVLNKTDHVDKGITFPGGHVENSESIEESVIREFREETGLTIINPILCGLKDWIEPDGLRYIVFIYKASEYSGELKSSKEGNVRWMNINEVKDSATIYYTNEVLELISSDKFQELFIIEDEIVRL